MTFYNFLRALSTMTRSTMYGYSPQGGRETKTDYNHTPDTDSAWIKYWWYFTNLLRASHNFSGRSHFHNSLTTLPQTITFLKLAIFFAATPSLIPTQIGNIKSAKEGSANRVKAKHHSGFRNEWCHDRHKTASNLYYIHICALSCQHWRLDIFSNLPSFDLRLA